MKIKLNFTIIYFPVHLWPDTHTTVVHKHTVLQCKGQMHQVCIIHLCFLLFRHSLYAFVLSLVENNLPQLYLGIQLYSAKEACRVRWWFCGEACCEINPRLKSWNFSYLSCCALTFQGDWNFSIKLLFVVILEIICTALYLLVDELKHIPTVQ